MGFAVTPNQSAAMKALGDFLVGVLPDSTPVLQAQNNRVPEPKEPNFVVMTPTLRPRLATNIEADADVSFTASIAGTLMTVTAVEHGTIREGAIVFGVDVAALTTVGAQVGGTAGGVGTYAVSPSQTVSSRAMFAGVVDMTQKTMLRVQLDVHGPNGGDNAQIISTMFRSTYAVRRFSEDLLDVVAPLYCEDPRQLPFHNAQQQVEDRWVVEASLQVNEVVVVPQQFADAAEVEMIDVDAAHPPS